MADRANIAASYRWRMLFVTLFCVAFAMWCVYDGAVGYPAQAVRANKYLELKEPGHEGWKDEWKEFAMEKGWPTTDPGKPKVQADFIVQFMMAGIIGVIGIPFLYIYVSTRGKWIEMDDDGFSTSWGQRCEFDQITGFDKRKWYNKGIAVIRYDDNGKQRRLTLDDCKYDREPTELFVREVTLDLNEDQIIGGRATDYDDEEVDDENVEEESVVDEAEETSEEADVVDEKK